MKEFIEKKLPNGMPVYYYCDESLKRVYASINVKYGTDGYYDKFIYDKNTYSANPALAHYLEHFLIETSKNKAMMEKFPKKGYETNAVTYTDMTSFYFVGIDTKQGIIKSIIDLIDTVEEPDFTESNIEMVKKAIIQELNGDDDDRYDIARANNRHNLHVAYDPVPVNNNVLGSIKTTEAITQEEARICYDAYYNDDNKFIVIGGNIDIDKIHNKISSYYRKRKHPNLYKPYSYEVDIGVRKELEIIEMSTDADYVVSSLKLPIDKNISEFEMNFYIKAFLTCKFLMSNTYIQKMIKEKYLTGKIHRQCNFFNGVCDVTITFESYNSKAALKRIEEILSNKTVKKKDFELCKKDYLVADIQKRDNMYSVFKNYPIMTYFSKKLDRASDIQNFKYSDFKKYIEKIDFKFETTTIITKKN